MNKPDSEKTDRELLEELITELRVIKSDLRIAKETIATLSKKDFRSYADREADERRREYREGNW